MSNKPTIIYAHDPMCSWCYGFKPVLAEVTKAFRSSHNIEYILGGLAPDTNTLMPQTMQQQIKSNWQQIEQSIPGIKFNYNFWNENKPRRSTYPACRAVISAKKQNAEIEMINAIQHAYYLSAQNPSDDIVLYNLAEEIDLNISIFQSDFHSKKTDIELIQQVSLCQKIGANSFPSLLLLKNSQYHHIVIDYNNADIIIEHILNCT